MDKRSKIVMKQLKTAMYITVAAIVLGLFAGVLHAAPKAAPKKETVKQAAPVKKAEEPKKDPNRKKPTLKKKYADKK